ncbi:MAG TPA: SpaA isopeptide-forming pilin-related protein [Candidatus Hydromicrobium sp.]
MSYLKNSLRLKITVFLLITALIFWLIPSNLIFGEEGGGDGGTVLEGGEVIPPEDITPPVITLNENNLVTVVVGSEYTDAGATASDDVDGDITGSIAVNNPVDISTLGTYSVTYNVSDNAGNAAAEVIRVVNVVEQIVEETLIVNPITNPVLSTDKADYAPEETVIITGTGFLPNAVYTIVVTRPDGSVVIGDGSFVPGSDSVLSDASGNFTYNYTLDGIMGTYQVDAKNEAGNTVASTSFTDSWEGDIYATKDVRNSSGGNISDGNHFTLKLWKASSEFGSYSYVGSDDVWEGHNAHWNDMEPYRWYKVTEDTESGYTLHSITENPQYLSSNSDDDTFNVVNYKDPSGPKTSLTISKTATASGEGYITWSIEKSVDPDDFDLLIGETSTAHYTVVVTPTYHETGMVVSGNIHIQNDTGAPGEDKTASITYVKDMIEYKIGSGSWTELKTETISGPFTIPTGGSIDVPYSVSFTPVPGATAYRNTALVGLANHPDGFHEFHYTIDFSISGGTVTEDAFADVTDSLQGYLGEAWVGNPATQTFSYNRQVGPYLSVGDYTVNNIAIVTGKDSEDTDSDSESIDVHVSGGSITITKTNLQGTDTAKLYLWKTNGAAPDTQISPVKIVGNGVTTATWSGLAYDTYYVNEDFAGITTNVYTYTVSNPVASNIVVNSSTPVARTVANIPILGTVNLTKTFAGVTTTVNFYLKDTTGQYYLANGAPAANKAAAARSISANGLIQWTGLPVPRNYIIEEDTVPGYVLEITPSTFTIDASTQDQTVAVSATNRELGSIEIFKTDQVTGDPLEGSTFELWKFSSPGTQIDTIVLGPGSGGYYKWEDLEWGHYQVIETIAPPGYLLAPPVDVYIDLENGLHHVLREEIADPRIPGKVTVIKTDPSGATLDGAGFTIYYKDSGNPVMPERFTSGGLVTFDGLEWGTYIISETTVPSGFTKAGDVEVTIGLDNAEAGVTINIIDTKTPPPPPPPPPPPTITTGGGIQVLGIQELPFTGMDPIIPISGISSIFAGGLMVVLSAIRKRFGRK